MRLWTSTACAAHSRSGSRILWTLKATDCRIDVENARILPLHVSPLLLHVLMHASLPYHSIKERVNCLFAPFCLMTRLLHGVLYLLLHGVFFAKPSWRMPFALYADVVEKKPHTLLS